MEGLFFFFKCKQLLWIHFDADTILMSIHFKVFTGTVITVVKLKSHKIYLSSVC